MKIVILDGYTLNPGDLTWEGFKSLGEVAIYNRSSSHEIIERIGDAEVVITNKTPITRKTLDLCPSVKYIGVLATGYNVVDIVAAKQKKIPVTNIPNYGTASVAQFTISLLLELCNNVGIHSKSVKRGDWSNCEDFCYWKRPLIELNEKTMGIIGYGRIGQATAKIAQAFGMNIIALKKNYDAYLESDNLKFTNNLSYLLKNSDVISLHCPLTPSTEGIINKENISKMKDGAIVINTSRGALINEKDLAEALNSGKLLGAALDVVNIEPMAKDNILLNAKNCIITPHIAWAPKEARQRLMDIAISNLTSFLNGNLVNVVN